MLKKLTKGFIGLFAITFTLVSMNSLLISCNDEDYYESNPNVDRTAQRSNFINAIKLTGEKHLARIPKFENARVPGQAEQDYVVDAVGGEEELQDIIVQVQPASLDLIRSYDISDAEIIELFGSLDNPAIEEAAMLIVETDNLLAHGSTLDIFVSEDYVSSLYSAFGTQAYALQEDPTFGGCVGEAAGIKILTDALQGGLKKLGKKGALKLMGKIAGRYLGWVGAAVMVVEFSECMGWTDLY